LSHSKASEPLPIVSSTTGFATSSPFSLFANITTPDFVFGSAITKPLNEPLSPQCQSASVPSLRSMPHPNPQNRFFDSCFGSCLMQILHSGLSVDFRRFHLAKSRRLEPFSSENRLNK
jgi:hypothetical protein